MNGGKTRDEMIGSNMGLVHACARKFIGRGAEYDDLVQAGCVGLIKAVDNFDESRGFLFSTYAVPMIEGEIRRFLRDSSFLRVSRQIKDLSYHYLKEKEKYINEYGEIPTLDYFKEKLVFLYIVIVDTTKFSLYLSLVF